MVQVVNVGIDTIKVNVKYLDEQGKPAKVQAFPAWLEERLQAWQEQAREENKLLPTAMTFDDARLLMRPNGANVWKYIVTNDSVQLQMVPRLTLPALARLTFYSPYLWKQTSPQEAVDEVHAFCMDVFGPNVMLQAAQIDLCVDVVGLTIPTNWRMVFVGRARSKEDIEASQKDQSHYRGSKLETVLFSGHGRPMSAKLYDKIAEIKQHSPDKTWFFDLWKRGGWNGTDRVWRVEFSLEREGLHEMDLEDIYDALRNLKRIWAYCTQEWLRLVVPANTKNRTRWPTSRAWRDIQHAFDDYGCKLAEALGPLVRERKREVNLDRGVAAIAGYATTFGAWWEQEGGEAFTDQEALLDVVVERVKERWQKQELSLVDVIEEKKFLYGRKG
jgi:hypothetical protein